MHSGSSEDAESLVNVVVVASKICCNISVIGERLLLGAGPSRLSFCLLLENP